MSNRLGSVVAEELTDPGQLAEARAQWDRLERNTTWFRAHAAEIFRKHRGKSICVAGQELFVADSPREARELAKRAHPDDDGTIVRFIPVEKLQRVYADRR